MSSTRDMLLDSAEGHIRRRGYAGFSFADLTEAAGIRKASIHHHFPTKEDLALALVEVYARRFADTLEDLRRATPGLRARLAGYADLHRVGLLDGRLCLCAMLAADRALVGPRVAAGVAAFFAANRRWLEDALASVPSDGATLDPVTEARAFQAQVIGAMLVAHASSDVASFDRAIATALDRLAPVA